MESKLIKIALAGITALALTGCPAEKHIASGPAEKPHVWTEAELNAYFPKLDIPVSYFKGFDDCEIKDLDGDGKPDFVGRYPRTYCIAPSYQDRAIREGFGLLDDAVVMTPQMINDLTQFVNSQRSFAKGYLQAKGLYSK